MQLQFVIYCYSVIFMFLFAWYTWNGGIFAYLSREKERKKEKLICYINICGFLCICNLVILIFISFKTLYVYFFLYIYTFVKWYIILNEVKLMIHNSWFDNNAGGHFDTDESWEKFWCMLYTINKFSHRWLLAIRWLTFCFLP